MTITVVGSIHIDFYIKVDRFPMIGETLIGKGFQISPGGKGANQAVGCSKLGEETYIVGKIGKDFSNYLIDNFKTSNVKTDFLKIDPRYNTGVAFIILNETTGENMIIIDPGADYSITEKDIDDALEAITRSEIILLQLEIPMKINFYTSKLAAEKGKTVILNPAPVSKLPEDIFKYVKIITPNRVEASQLTDVEVKDLNTAVGAGRKLIEKGVMYSIITLGSQGSVLIKPDKALYYPPFRVDVVDTTGAGDAFNAGLAVALSQGYPIEEAVKWANACAALKITKIGAQSGLPNKHELEEFLDRHEDYREITL